MASLFLAAPPLKAMAEPRPMYLSEPTEEFKRKQLVLKREFNEILEKFEADDITDEKALVKDLKGLQNQIVKSAGLPLGIKKDELFKKIRRKKASGEWPVPAEIAYQSLIGEIRFQQSPNIDKENGN